MLKKLICPLSLVLAATFATAAWGGTHKVRVNDPALAKSLVARGGRLIADYGSFQIIESDTVPAAPAELVDDFDVIQLNARRLDTRAPETQALRRPVAAVSGKRLHLVQFASPIKPEWVTALEQSGVAVVAYIPHNAYLIYGNGEALARMQSWARGAGCVQWEGAYADDYKVHPRAGIVPAKAATSKAGSGLFAVQLVADADSNPATLALLDQLKVGPIRTQFRVLKYLDVIVPLPADQLASVAARPDVVSIQPDFEPEKLDESQDQIVAGNLAGGLPTGPGYLAWLAGKGFSQSQFDASGFVVDVCDSGIDNGTASPGHFGLYALGDPRLSSRVVYNQLEGTPNPGSTLQGCDGHGNLDAHIVAGYRAFTNGFPFADAAAFDYGLGVCPFVKIGSSVVFDPIFFTSPNYANQESDAYQQGARINVNSWGSQYPAGTYDIKAQTYDALVRDAQPDGSTYSTSSNQQMVIIFPVGNSGPGSQTVYSPGSAKNVITVGAAENVRSLSPANGGNDMSGNDGCNTPDIQADNANDLAVFSSRGPCADGRMKPDLVAPGTHVTGGVAQGGLATTNGTGVAIACFNAVGVAALPGAGECGTPATGNPDNFFPLSQQFYTVSSGTSHAAPAVAGACALLRQYFINQALPPPSPAMTKAGLINAARSLTGVGANDNLWSPAQGMGELNLGPLFDGVPRILRDQVSADKFTATGQTRTFTGTITDPTKPFRVTLAWTDAPGNTTGNAFNNDLDLTVTVGGTVYKGNVFNGASSIPGGAYDRENNVESVFLPAGLSGAFAVTVTAANINSDGVPNEPPALDQDFALVVYNAVSAPLPVFALNSAALIAESCSPANGWVDPGETVTVAFALQNAGTVGTTNLVGTLLATNGVVLPGSPQTYGALLAGGGAVTQAFSFTAAGTCGGTINPVLQLQDGPANLGTLNTSFTLGTEFVTQETATNPGAIQIPGFGTVGPASPYPSTISISGVTGTVSKVTVTVAGLTHSYPADVDILLVAPSGTNVLLMSDCGEDNGISGLTLTFDDSAAVSLPYSQPINSGIYRPTSYAATPHVFYSPGPPSPFGSALAAFNGLDPNGTWSLYVQDVAAQDIGNIAQGWGISITTSNAVCCGAPLVLASPVLTNGTAALRWSAVPGQTYRLQYKTNLNDATWSSLSPDVTATNTSAGKIDVLNPALRRFYRVGVVP